MYNYNQSNQPKISSIPNQNLQENFETSDHVTPTSMSSNLRLYVKLKLAFV